MTKNPANPVYGIQAAPFSAAIHVGRLSKDRTMFLDSAANPKEDCTDMAIFAVGDYARKHHGGGMKVDFDDCVVTVKIEMKEPDNG